MENTNLIQIHFYFMHDGEIINRRLSKNSSMPVFMSLSLKCRHRPMVGDSITVSQVLSAEMAYLSGDKDWDKYNKERFKIEVDTLKKYGIELDTELKIYKVQINFFVSYSSVDFNVYVNV